MPEIAPLPFDIIDPAMPPLPPADYTGWIAGAAILALAGLGLGILYWRRTRARRLARRQLAQARRAELRGSEAAFAIAAALRAGFGLARILATEASDARWRGFVERLDRLRYGAGPGNAVESDRLFEEAARWLRGKTPC